MRRAFAACLAIGCGGSGGMEPVDAALPPCEAPDVPAAAPDGPNGWRAGMIMDPVLEP